MSMNINSKKHILRNVISGAIVSSVFIAPLVFAMGEDDPLLTMVRVHELQYLQENSNDIVEWDADGWVGHDVSKLWFKTQGEYVNSNEDSGIEKADIELLYSRAFAPNWDWQAGVRQDFVPEVDGRDRSWVSFGLMGTAYNFWELDTSLFVGEESSVQLVFQYEREYMITQKWVLTPDIEVVFNGDNNQRYSEGAGLSEAELSLRLGYEVTRNFQPYVGISAVQSFGNTRDFIKDEGEDSGNVSATIGVHFWF